MELALDGTGFAPGEDYTNSLSFWLAGCMEANGKLLTNEETRCAFEMLRQLTPEHELLKLAPTSPTAVYTTLVTLWMLTLQRLSGGSSMAAVVKETLIHSKNLLPDNKRVREETLSKNTGAYSEARARLPLEAVKLFANSVCQSLVERTPSWFGEQRAYILDGTTITLSPTSELAEAFPPAINQFGVTVWPVLMLLVAHELQSGCALIPEIGAMYGQDNTSEVQQATEIAKRLPARSIVMADSGQGIFRVAYAMVSQKHDILLRLTKSRYKSMRRQAKLIQTTDSSSMHQLQWVPSAKDRRTNPDLPGDAAVSVILHQITLASGEDLLLVTTIPYTSEEAAEAYSHRYDVEHDIRDLKVTLGLEKIRGRSEAMVRKEILCSIVAYNLLLEFRREAAKIAKLPPRRLSFTYVWNTFEIFLLRQSPCSAEDWLVRYEKALMIASKDKLPNRPDRSYPRKAHTRRQKSTKFMKNPSPQQIPKTEAPTRPSPK